MVIFYHETVEKSSFFFDLADFLLTMVIFCAIIFAKKIGGILMTIGERITIIRKNSEEKTLAKFGEKLGVSNTAISRIEKGQRGLTDQMCKAICRAYNVSEQWLRTGEGEMYETMTVDKNLLSLANEITNAPDSDPTKQFLSRLARLSESEWFALERLFANI